MQNEKRTKEKKTVDQIKIYLCFAWSWNSIRMTKSKRKRGTNQWTKTPPPWSSPDWINAFVVAKCSKRFSSSTSWTPMARWSLKLAKSSLSGRSSCRTVTTWVIFAFSRATLFLTDMILKVGKRERGRGGVVSEICYERENNGKKQCWFMHHYLMMCINDETCAECRETKRWWERTRQYRGLNSLEFDLPPPWLRFRGW